MKFVLSIIVCSAIYNACIDPYQMPDTYNSHYECMIGGYEESLNKVKELGAIEMNNHLTIIKFFCMEEKIIIPLLKPTENDV